ncbi:MAG TPA: Ku protein [Thermoanaerobaculia bacterium]|jgi:DNA end-binding protein Ku
MARKRAATPKRLAHPSRAAALPRPIWTGQISFGLVSIPVALSSAVEASERISFHLLHRKDLAPIHYKKFCSLEDVEVGNDEIVRGRKSGKNHWTVVEKKDLDEAAEEATPEESRDVIEVLEFVSPDAVDFLSIDEPYYVVPRKGGEKAYVLLRRALAERSRTGIVRVTLRTRPHLAALSPRGDALTLVTLRPFEEMRKPSRWGIPAASARPAEVALAEQLVDRLSGNGWDPARHPDSYRKALEKLLASKKGRGAPGEAARPSGENVVDLMEALRRSVAGRSRRGVRRSASRKAGAA